MALLQFKSEVLNIIQDSPTVKTLELSVPADFKFLPGQFVMVAAPLMVNTAQEITRRAYSISSEPSLRGKIWISVKKVEGGKVSGYLHSIKVGDVIQVTGPMGHFHIHEESLHRDIVLISAGIGVAPFRGIIPDLLHKGFSKQLILLRGIRYMNERLFQEEFMRLSFQYPNFKKYSAVSKPEHSGHTLDIGRVHVLIDKYIPHSTEADYYVCGPHQMIDDVVAELNKRGIPHRHVHFERYD